MWSISLDLEAVFNTATVDGYFQRKPKPKIKYVKITVDFCVHSPPGGESVNIVNNGVVSYYPSPSLVYDAVGSGLAAAECTLWEWT